MFDQLLQAYPEVHPEDFVTFGVLQISHVGGQPGSGVRWPASSPAW